MTSSDSRIKQVLAALRRGDHEWVHKGARSGRGWRGDWCRAWMRNHVKKFADFNPTTRTANLDPDALEVRHLLYVMDWRQRAPSARPGPAIKFSRFAELWEMVKTDGYVHKGETFQIKIRPPRSGFTCDICQKLFSLRRNSSTQSEKNDITHQLRQHLQQAREARDSYADHILLSELNACIASIAIDAADQAKHHCPKHSFQCRSLSRVQKIVQQFIGVLDHRLGYGLYRRLPYVQKGANLTLTIILDLIRRGFMRDKSKVYLQWDGASENVAKTNLRFFIWLLLTCEKKNLPLETIVVCRCCRRYIYCCYGYACSKCHTDIIQLFVGC